MFKNLALITAVAVLCILCYQLGKSRAKIKYITQEKEVVRYEKNCAAGLLAQPNVTDDTITRLFDSNLL